MVPWLLVTCLHAVKRNYQHKSASRRRQIRTHKDSLWRRPPSGPVLMPEVLGRYARARHDSSLDDGRHCVASWGARLPQFAPAVSRC